MPDDTGDGRASSSGNLWRHRDYLKLWSASSISLLGTQVTLLAVPLIALKILKASAFEVGLLVSIERLPFLLVGLPAGAIVDRLRRRPVLIVGDLGRALTLGSVPAAYALHQLSMAQLYVVVFVTGVLTVFFDVAYQSYLPALIDRGQLVEGNAKLEVSHSGSQIAGPALAGLLYTALRAGAILADAVSYLWSALLVLVIRRPEPVPTAHLLAGGGKVSLRRQIAEGLSYVWRHPYLRPIAACTATSNLFTSMLDAIYVTYAVRVLHLSAATIGVIASVASVGFLIGAVFSRRLASSFGVGPTIVASSTLFGLPLLLIPLAPKGAPIPWLVAAFLVLSFVTPVYNITQVSLRQAICPDRLQGRMNATMRFMVWGTLPVGALMGGYLASSNVLGLRNTLIVSAIGGMLPFFTVVLSPVRSLREIPAMEPDLLA